MDELGAASPDECLAPEAEIEAVDIASFLKNTPGEVPVSSNDDDDKEDDKPIPTGRLMPTILCPVKWFMYHLMLKLEENTVE